MLDTISFRCLFGGLAWGGKVEHVRATFSAVQSHLPAVQRPSSDSDEQAMYGLDVSYEMPVPVLEIW